MTKNIIFQVLATLTLITTLLPFGTEAQSSGTKAVFNKNSVDLTRRSSFEVDPVTQALNIQIDLQEYSGRGIGTPVSLKWNSKLWRMQDEGCFWYDNPNTPPAHMTQPMYSEYGMSGWTSTLGAPSLEPITGPFAVWADHGGAIQNATGRPWDCVDDQPMPNDCYENDPNCDNRPVRFYVKRLMLHTPDGGSVELRQSDTLFPQITSGGDIYRAVDGSGIFYNEANNTLFLPDGSKYVWDTSLGRIYHLDRSGNQRTYTYSTNSWTDTMGRTLVSPLPPQQEPAATFEMPGIEGDLEYDLIWEPLEDSLTDPNDPLRYKGSATVNGNATQSWSPYLFSGDNIDLAATPGDDNPPLFNPSVLTKIGLPDGRFYEFSYNAYGEIDKIILPTGAYKRYRYDVLEPRFGSTSSYTQVNRGVVEMWESPTGDPNEESSHHWEFEGAKVYPDYVITTTAPDGTYTKRTVEVDGAASSRGWGFNLAPEGRIIDEQFFSTADQLLRRTLNTYTYDGPIFDPSATTSGLESDPFNPPASQGASRNARLTTKTELIVEGTDALAKTTTFEYDADLNVTGTNEYGFVSISYATATASSPTISAGTLLRRTESTYLLSDSNVAQQTKDAYRARNLIRLPTETLVKDGSDNVTAKTQFVYDETGTYPLISAGTHSQWTDPGTNYRGNVTTAKHWHDITNSLYIQTHAQYDNFGNLRKAWDGNGNMTETVFASIYAYAYPTSVITPIPDTNGTYGSSTAFTSSTVYDYNTGLPTSVTDANGQTTTMEYEDPLLRPTKVIAPNGHETVTEYGAGTDAASRWVKVTTDLDNTNTKYAYAWFDGLGRTWLSQSEDSAGDVFAVTCYDNMGRVSKTSNPFRNVSNPTCSSSLEWTTPAYDDLGRTITVTTPDSAVVETTYGLATSGSQIGTYVTVEDQANKVRRSITNALGHLTRVDEPNGSNVLGTIASPNQPTYYHYNTLGKMVRVQQGDQNRYFMYDSLGQMLRVKQPEQDVNTGLNTSGNPDNNSWTAGFSYDHNGNVLTATDAKGTTITNVYDAMGRVTQRSYNDSPQTPTVNFYYDGTGLPSVPTYSKGKLTKVSSSVSESRYTEFDVAGRLLEYKQITDGQTYTSEYEYNLSGALVKETYPSGRVVENSFDSNGDLSRIYGKADPSAMVRTYANTFSYTPDGRIEKLRLGNGLWEAAKFNNRLQVTEFSLGHGVSSGDVWKNNYEYGELQGNGTVNGTKNTGNIGKQTVTFAGLANPFVQTYKYDPLYRLTEAKETSNGNQVWKQVFDYDRYGNRTTYDKWLGTTAQTLTTVEEPTVDNTTNRISSSGYTFDDNGNMVVDADGRQFTFNGDNKQTKVQDDEDNVIGEYFYDGEGKRIKKVVGSDTTVFVYSAGKLIAEYSTETPASNPTTSWTVTDQLGSPRVIVDALGAVVSRRDFMPFGEELGADGTYRTTGQKYGQTDSVRQKFTGYQHDNETGLDFAEARMYQNLNGRFTAIDPLLSSGKSANPQTFNRYVYVMNSPLIMTDPTGLQAGKWYRPTVANGMPLEYFKDGQVPDGYTEVTSRNRRGELIIAGEGLETWQVIRLNPNGPYESGYGFDLDDWLLMSNYDYNGWDVVRTDEAAEAYYRSGAVQDVSVEFYMTAIPLAQGATTLLRAGAGSRLAAQQLADDALVVRNGIPDADRFIKGSGVTSDADGILSGVSVKSANGKTVEELVTGPLVTKNGQIGVTTVGDIRRAGGIITPDKPTNPLNPFHCEICNLTGAELEKIFVQRPNPLKLQ